MQIRLLFRKFLQDFLQHLLEQRPDVIAAENTLIAETERIGVYQAMRFPSFNLTGFFGVASP